MPNDRIYYVLCADNCKFEGMTKEQIFDAIAEATGHTPTPVDQAFITKIKEQNAQHNTKIWTGTEAEYNALAVKDPDTLYFVGGNKIQPGAGGQIDASDIISGEVALARGGTGQNFANFAALSDAVGSGGNWIDVSEKFKNEITIIHSGCTILDVEAYIYEKNYISLRLTFSFSTGASAFALNDYHLFTVPSFALTKASVSSSDPCNVMQLDNAGKFKYTNIQTITSNYPQSFSQFYALKTPYSE